jgi:hypothetical protein
MKLSQLEELLEEDLGWRKKELSTLILIAKNTNEEVVLKSIILLLYAHWEGYIKKSSKLYLKYISESKKNLNELTQNFKAVALKNLISQCFQSKDSLTLQNEISVINGLSKAETKKFKIAIDINNDYDKSIIDTNANLKPKVFKNIISIIGLNYKSQIASKEKYIDSHLLANRNLIGHGSKYKKIIDSGFELEIKDIEKLRDIIFSIIDNYREELVEYSKEEYFLNSNKENLAIFLAQKEDELEATFKSIESKYE